LKNAERETVEQTIISGLLRPRPEYGPELQAQVEADVRSNSPALRAAIEKKLTDEFGKLPKPPDVHVEEPEPRVFRIVTDLPRAYGLSDEKTHDTIQQCVFGVANLDQRIADMSAYSAIIGFTEAEAPLLFGKLAGIVAQQNPRPLEEQFARVVTLAGLPHFASARKVNVEKLLEVRESKECIEFRSWLTKVGTISDEEVVSMIKGIRNRLGAMVDTGAGKVLRFAATTALGLIPGAGMVVGPVAGALDSFLVEKVFPSSGVVAFLAQKYPSLFEHST
jgi:hypothetical protein